MELTVATTNIVDGLNDVRLLPRAHFEELVNELLPRCDDWRILGRELVYRGWLTSFQIQELLGGRGRELILGSYVLLEPIAEGGMGQVFRSRNWKLGAAAAVKVIGSKHANEPSASERFLREVRALGAIHHPNVVHALDAGREAGRLYCAMEYVPGVNLGIFLADRGALPIETACRYAAQIARGLSHISKLGLVHRDVKPANILVTQDGSTIKLVDLGLARFDRPNWDVPASNLTSVGMMIGTPDYVAPEQIRNSRHADIRSDLYSLGCTFYQMLAGFVPFAGLDSVAKMFMHQTTEPISVERIRPDVPPTVAAIVRKLMAKKPRDRYQDPAEVASLLQPHVLAAGDTLSDAATITMPGAPASVPDLNLPRTDEIPVDRLVLLTEQDTEMVLKHQPRPGVVRIWLERWQWPISAAIAALALGAVAALS